jgi:hypothetical protein
VEKMKEIYIFIKIGRLYICNKFWLMHDQGGTRYFYSCDWFLGIQLVAKTSDYWAIWSNRNYQSNLGHQSNRIAWSIWVEKKIIAYVKDEGSNLTIMIIALKSIVKCEVLSLDESFQGMCLDHVFSKAYYYCYNWWKGLQKFSICF